MSTDDFIELAASADFVLRKQDIGEHEISFHTNGKVELKELGIFPNFTHLIVRKNGFLYSINIEDGKMDVQPMKPDSPKLL